MSHCLFLTFRGPTPVSEAAARAWARTLHGASGAARTVVHLPAQAVDPFLRDDSPPALALQLYFDRWRALEAALADDGPLQHQAGSAPPGLEGTQQTMAVRPIDVPEARAHGERRHCTYLVAYEGSAADPAEWHAHYDANHVPLMRQLPGLRELEVCKPLACPSALPWPPAEAMQRNKVVFDSPEALSAALASPIRHAMREDHHRAPPFDGRATHFAMHSWVV